MAEDFTLYADGLNTPARNVEVVTPHDTTNLTQPSRGLIIGVGGNISVETVGGQSAVIITVATGAILPIMVTRVNSTATTATNIVSMY